MALSGLEIFKLLPKTNCRDCGRPTCLAFAMQLAQKKANLSDCPHVSDEAKSALDEASAPPIRGVTIGSGDRALKMGEETVLFRHDEKFYNPAGIAVRVRDTLSPDDLREKYKRIQALRFVRVGMDLEVEAAAVENASGEAAKFEEAVKIAAEETDLVLVLMSETPEHICRALEVCADKRPAPSLEELADLTGKVTAEGVEDLVLDFVSTDPKTLLQSLTMARRAALKKTFRQLGYPSIAFTGVDDPFDDSARACM